MTSHVMQIFLCLFAMTWSSKLLHYPYFTHPLKIKSLLLFSCQCNGIYCMCVLGFINIFSLSGKYAAILNISSIGRTTLM